MNLLLVRHGQTDWNREGRYQGRLDVPLNTEGRRQAVRTAAFLRRYAVKRILSSPQARCLETAGTIARGTGGAVSHVPELREIDHGPWQGMLREEIRQAYPAQWEQWRSSPHQLRLAGAESVPEAASRLQRLVRRLGSQDFCMVGHGTMNQILLALMVGKPLHSLHSISQDNACVNHLEVTPQGTLIHLLNSTVHLSCRAEPGARS